MSSLRRGSQMREARALVTLAAAAVLALAATSPRARTQQIPSSSGWRDVSLAEYLQHLQTLESAVADCSAQLKLKTSPPAAGNACDPARVGPNDLVHWPGAPASQSREVRYDWLRAVLSRASKNGGSAPAVGLGKLSPAKEKAPDVSVLLNDARQRLQIDEQQAGGPPAANPAYADERKSLDTILAQREYQGVTKVSAKDRAVEWFYNQLDKILMSLAGFGARARWAARLLEGLLLGGIAVALIWFFIRIERNARVRLIPDVELAPGSPSAREWQLWIKDAQTAAASGLWREAIHSVYWASISQLESRRLWPADRARTPREYLSLISGHDPRKPTLTALTGSFERTWYGGRDAAAVDFDAAMALAAELGVEAK